MRIGIHGGVTARLDNALDELVATARDAHDHGLDFWMPQMFDVDALTALAVVGRELPGLHVGTAVVPTYPRHPLVTAMQALTVAAATGNRFVLGIGLSHQIVIEGSYGMSYSKPIRHMRDYLEILLPAVRGERVAYEGADLTGRVFSPMKVPGAEPPPVVIAALGSQMLELAGSVADGTALWMVGPRTVADHIVPRLSAAADRAGRPRPRVVVGLPVSVTADVDAARDRAARTFAMYNTLSSYRAMLDREGVEGPSDVAVVGDEEAVASQLRHLEEIGATDLSLPVFGNRDDRERTLRLLAELAEAS